MKRFIIFFLLLAVVIPSQAQSRGGVSGRPPFRIFTDIARFRGDSTHVYVEVYYSIDVSQLKYAKAGDNYRADVVMSIYLKRSADDSIVVGQSWRIPFSVADTTALQVSRTYVDALGFYVKPDVYRLYIIGRDVNAAMRRDSLSVPIDIPPVEKSKIALSDIELCSSIVSAENDSANRFYKNTYEVRPNPARFFGINQPVLFYYAEGYNLLQGVSPTFKSQVSVENAVGKKVYESERTRRRVNESSVEVGTVNVASLSNGTYTFKYALLDSAANTAVVATKRFFVYNPSVAQDTLTPHGENSYMASEYSTMNEAELDKEFAIARYLASKDELNQYPKLKGVESKRKMLYDFWNKRDEDPSTPENEAKKEYMKRVDYANTYYKTGFREGWKTDRGRVFIVYGPPDEVERHANEIDVKPYEIWFYNSIQGGVQFVFGDRTGFSDYTLLHSTHRDEMQDENWMRQIQAQ
jgi:GWxTD domain-containing protein